MIIHTKHRQFDTTEKSAVGATSGDWLSPPASRKYGAWRSPGWWPLKTEFSVWAGRRKCSQCKPAPREEIESLLTSATRL